MHRKWQNSIVSRAERLFIIAATVGAAFATEFSPEENVSEFLFAPHKTGSVLVHVPVRNGTPNSTLVVVGDLCCGLSVDQVWTNGVLIGPLAETTIPISVHVGSAGVVSRELTINVHGEDGERRTILQRLDLERDFPIKLAPHGLTWDNNRGRPSESWRKVCFPVCEGIVLADYSVPPGYQVKITDEDGMEVQLPSARASALHVRPLLSFAPKATDVGPTGDFIWLRFSDDSGTLKSMPVRVSSTR